MFQWWPKRKKTLWQSRDILCLSAGLETSQHPLSRSLVSWEKEVWAAVLIHQSKHSCKHLTWKRNAGKISFLVFHKCFLLKHLQELLIFNMKGNKWSLIQAVGRCLLIVNVWSTVCSSSGTEVKHKTKKSTESWERHGVIVDWSPSTASWQTYFTAGHLLNLASYEIWIQVCCFTSLIHLYSLKPDWSKYFYTSHVDLSRVLYSTFSMIAHVATHVVKLTAEKWWDC